MPANSFRTTTQDTDEIIWMSERDGWNHLYLIDARTGTVKNPITQGNWVVREVDRVDEEQRQIWFRAGGIYPEQDPYYIHYCRINFDGSGLTMLTAGNGTHSVRFSPDRRFLVDTYSRVDMAPRRGTATGRERGPDLRTGARGHVRIARHRLAASRTLRGEGS